MDFSGVTIFRHTITMIVVVWRFLYCDEILKVVREDMMNDTFMKEKPILPLLTSMALPMVVSMLVNSLYNIVDSLFVAKINEKAMTALSLVYPLQNLMNAIAIGFGIGINAVIAFHLGAGNREKADIAATHGFIFALIHSVIMMAAGILLMPVFLRMFTGDAEVIEMGMQYSVIVFLFAPTIMIELVFEKLFQATGNMKVTMLSLMCGSIANIILDPLMIFGIGLFPELGIRGAALATGLGQLLTWVIYIVAYLSPKQTVHFQWKYRHLDSAIDRKLYGVGIPAIFNLALPSLLISLLNGLLAAYSQSYVVVLGIYYKLQTFLYLPANGIIQGMRPVIGYNYGAGEKERVKKIYRLTLYMTGSIMILGTILCLLASGQLIGFFTTNSETIRIGQTALRVISMGFVISAVSVTASGALEGLGKGKESFQISLCRYLITIVPAAWILCRIGGAEWVWHAFWISETITALIAWRIYHKSVKMN